MTRSNGKKERFTKAHPCPICGGCDQAPRGKGLRCFGFRAGDFAHCTRPERAGSLSENPNSQTFPHRLTGDCDCAVRHDSTPAPVQALREPKRHIVATYDYLDENGQLRYQPVRYEPKDFKQRRPDGKGGWLWNLKGITRIPYRLPELLAAAKDATVFICEGEKDVVRLRALRLIATTSSEGAGKFRQELAPYFEGRNVVIIPDNDTDGRRHAEGVARTLHGVAASVRIWQWMEGEIPEGGDVSDWLDADHTVEELLSLVDVLVEYEPPATVAVNGATPETAEIDVDAYGAPAAPFPERAWHGLFAIYRDLVGPTTEASDVFHFWSFALAFGAILGRRVSVYRARQLFANFYVALVGPTGWGRKDTAIDRAEAVLKDLHQGTPEDTNQPFELIPGVGSAEGLLDALGGSGRVVVIRERELLSLLSKARQDGTSNLLPQLTALYDCPDHHTLRTRTKPVVCRNLFLSLIAGTTRTWLSKALTERDILGGFGNRFIFAPGHPKAPNPNPPKVNPTHWAELIATINDIRAWAANVGEPGVSPEASALFADWYLDFHAQAGGDGILPALAVRFQDFAWKLALLNAAQDMRPRIDADDIDKGLAVIEWHRLANQTLFTDFARNGRALEHTVIQRLRAAPRHEITDREMYRALDIPAADLQRAYDGLVHVGIVQDVGIQLNGSKKRIKGHRFVG